MSDRCAECERREIYCHTAKVEAQHDKMVIQAQAQRIAELEKALRFAERKLERGEGRRV